MDTPRIFPTRKIRGMTKKLQKDDNKKCICEQEHWLTFCPLNTKDKFWTMVLNNVVNKLSQKFHAHT
jgi:hypothetical protein